MPDYIEVPDQETVLLKIQSWCAYQERCHKEVSDKLREWNVPKQMSENIICRLIESDFLNEERFAMLFVRSKFNLKKWGRIKIKSELKQRRISEYVLQKAINQLEDEIYLKTLEEVIQKKSKLINEKNILRLNMKLINYALSKGYERDLVIHVLKV